MSQQKTYKGHLPLRLNLTVHEAGLLRMLASMRARNLYHEIERKPFIPEPGRQDARKVKAAVLQSAAAKLIAAIEKTLNPTSPKQESKNARNPRTLASRH